MYNPYSLMETLLKSIHSLTERLRATSDGSVTYDDLLSAALFYRDWQDTNQVVDQAQSIADRGELEHLARFARAIQTEVSEMLSLIPKLSDADSRAIAQAHDRAEYENFDRDILPAVEAYRKYRDFSNRLDFLPIDSPEYRSLEREADAAKAEYDRLHSTLTPDLTARRDEATASSWMVFRFSAEALRVLCMRLQQIALAIQNDIKDTQL